MPTRFKKSNIKRKPKQVWYNKKYSVAQIAAKAYRIATKVAGAINSEKHYFDESVSVSGLGDTWAVSPLCEIPVGDTEQTRTGNSIALKSIQMNKRIEWNAAGDNDQAVRVLLVRCNDNLENTTPTTSEIMLGQILSFRNMNYSRKYTILSDEVFYRDTSVQTMYPTPYFKKFFNKKDYKGDKTVATHITWNGNQDIDYGTGHLFLISISNKSTNKPNIAYNVCLRYYDN